MSVRQMTLAWATRCRTHTMKLVLVALADNANDQGVCWPGIDTLAEKCDLSRQGVMNQIDGLTEDGRIEVIKASGKSNTYQLHLGVNGVDPSTALTRQRRGPLPVNPVDPHPSTALTTPVNGVDPNRKEPSGEPSFNLSALPGGPVETKRKRKAKPVEYPSPIKEQVQAEFVRLWKETFQEVFDRDYPVVSPGRLYREAWDLCSNLNLSPKEIVEIAADAWVKIPQTHFLHQKAIVVHGFKQYFAEIVAELSRLKGEKPKASTPGASPFKGVKTI